MSGCSDCNNCQGNCDNRVPTLIVHGDAQRFAYIVGLSIAQLRAKIQVRAPELGVPADAIAYVGTFRADDPAFLDLPGPTWDAFIGADEEIHMTVKMVPEDYVIRQGDCLLDLHDRDNPLPVG